MSAPVDVLAVMDRDCFAAAQNRDDEGMIIPDQRVRMFGESREARAAVAELIQAADEASVALGESMEHTHQLVAHMRLCAALARVQGGAA